MFGVRGRPGAMAALRPRRHRRADRHLDHALQRGPLKNFLSPDHISHHSSLRKRPRFGGAVSPSGVSAPRRAACRAAPAGGPRRNHGRPDDLQQEEAPVLLRHATQPRTSPPTRLSSRYERAWGSIVPRWMAANAIRMNTAPTTCSTSVMPGFCPVTAACPPTATRSSCAGADPPGSAGRATTAPTRHGAARRARRSCLTTGEAKGDPRQLNPEQLLVMAASSCQMLWFLHLAAKARIDVVEYEDDRHRASCPRTSSPRA